MGGLSVRSENTHHTVITRSLNIIIDMCSNAYLATPFRFTPWCMQEFDDEVKSQEHTWEGFE